MEKEKYDFDANIEKDESTVVQSEAVSKAKAEIEEQKLKEETRKVRNRLERAEEDVKNAEKEGRFASKKKNILKKFSESLIAAKEEFEKTGDYKAYDKKTRELCDEKEKAIIEAKKLVYGDDYQWY